jgi:ABC-type nitrate/sulfonate/bicarbonate transport system substrate-binding protein
MTETTLRVCSFKGLQNLPAYVAMREGYFRARELSIDLSYTAGSAPQLAGLARGDYDLIQTAPDNVVNFDTNPAAFGVDAESAPHVSMLLGDSNGPLRVFARRGLASVDDLRGGTLGVDNPTSGFALVLRDLLWRQGLALDRDYHFTVAGGTHVRCEALLRGEIDATILYTPFDLRAATAGCVEIASSTGTYAAYASAATAGVQSWVEAHGDLVSRYLAAMLQALAWIYDPAHFDALQALVREEADFGVLVDLVARVCADYVAPERGAGPLAALDDAGLRQVIALRAAYGSAAQPLGQPSDYYDLRWYRDALSSVRAT